MSYEVDDLIRALGDTNGWVGCNAAEALGKIGDVHAVEPLCKALGYGDEGVRKYAAVALGKIGDRNVLPRKVLLCDTMSPQARVTALNVLSTKGEYYLDGRFYRYGTPTALPYCEQRKGDTDAQVRKAAEDLLRHLTLLRGSQPDQSMVLLRGASGQQSRDSSKELLRQSAESEVPPEPERLRLRERFRWQKARNRTKEDASEP